MQYIIYSIILVPNSYIISWANTLTFRYHFGILFKEIESGDTPVPAVSIFIYSIIQAKNITCIVLEYV